MILAINMTSKTYPAQLCSDPESNTLEFPRAWRSVGQAGAGSEIIETSDTEREEDPYGE